MDAGSENDICLGWKLAMTCGAAPCATFAPGGGQGPVCLINMSLVSHMCISFSTLHCDFGQHCAIECKWKLARHSPVACLATKTAKVTSRSNDHQKSIDLITFCEAHQRHQFVLIHIMRVLKSSVVSGIPVPL